MLHLHLEKQPQSALSFQVTLKCRSLRMPNNHWYIFPSSIHIEWKTVFHFLCPKAQTCTDHILHELPFPSEQTYRSVRIRQRGILSGFQNRHDFHPIPTFRDHACSQNVVINVKKAQFSSGGSALKRENRNPCKPGQELLHKSSAASSSSRDSGSINQKNFQSQSQADQIQAEQSLVQFLKQPLAARSREPDPRRALHQNFGNLKRA
jgi:hypothetical protein